MLKYPNGRAYEKKEHERTLRASAADTYGNRGMTLEADLNETNAYYLAQGIAVIHKKPTPVQIVRVDYPKRSAAVVKEAYFKQPSTTDYNGVYRGKYIDFEAKETRNRTSFPLQNFHEHQIEHMKQVLAHGAICFVILRFTTFDETYLLDAHYLLEYWERKQQGGRKSITKAEVERHGYVIPLGYHPRIDYIQIVDKLYF